MIYRKIQTVIGKNIKELPCISTTALLKNVSLEEAVTIATAAKEKDNPDNRAAAIAAKEVVSTAVIVATAGKKKNNPDPAAAGTSLVASTSTVCSC